MMGAASFRHITPAMRVYFGADSLDQLGGELDRLDASRAVIVCGASIARNAPIQSLLRESLGRRVAGMFDGVRAHGPLPVVAAAADMLRALEADAVVAVGGGSAIVTARAASILLAEGGDIRSLCTRFPAGGAPVSPRLARAKIPQLVVPTTPTTAYGKAGSAVFDPDEKRRLTLFDPKTRAASLFVHPALIMSAPVELVRGAALNAFVMAVQGLESATREPLADALLLHALRLLARWLPLLGSDADGVEARGDLVLAALLAGQGTDYTTGALASVIGHAIGARFDLDNGLVNAVLLPHTVRFNAAATGDRLADVSNILNSAQVDDPVTAIEAFLQAAPIPRRLRDLGLGASALPLIAADAGRDWFLHQNPRPIRDSSDLIEILKVAW
jgi:alcohol dehydrogenase class IV